MSAGFSDQDFIDAVNKAFTNVNKYIKLQAKLNDLMTTPNPTPEAIASLTLRVNDAKTKYQTSDVRAAITARARATRAVAAATTTARTSTDYTYISQLYKTAARTTYRAEVYEWIVHHPNNRNEQFARKLNITL